MVGVTSSTQLYEPIYFNFSGWIAAPVWGVLAACGFDRVCRAVGLRPSLRSRSGGRVDASRSLGLGRLDSPRR